MTKIYQTPNLEDWQGRQDTQANEYFYQIVQPLDLESMEQTKPIPKAFRVATRRTRSRAAECTVQSLSSETSAQQSRGLKGEGYGFAVLGFCSDAGVKRNNGRTGAKDGPSALRHALAQLPFHHSINLYDAGDIICSDDNLEAAQEELGNSIALLLKNNLTPIVFGGGSETAWGHYLGIAKHINKQSLGVINFNSHFDLRDLPSDGLGTSGTPFRQIAQAREKQSLPFDYYCLGIQRNANPPSLFEAAEKLNVRYILADEIHQRSNKRSLDLLDRVAQEHEHVYLSICLEAFAASIAPGVSDPQAYGLLAQQITPCIKQLAKSNKVISLNIVELAPNFDIDNRTAKLAANLIADYLHHAPGVKSQL